MGVLFSKPLPVAEEAQEALLALNGEVRLLKSGIVGALTWRTKTLSRIFLRVA